MMICSPNSGRSSDETYFFHTAALADYSVESVSWEDGEVWHSAKIASREGSIVVTLRPETKVIRELRGLFPNAWIAGWKYELDGTRDEAFAGGGRGMPRPLFE